MESDPYEIKPSNEWSDDERYLDQEKRIFEQNEGFITLQEGECKGRIIGGHIHCFTELLGTPYFPIIDEDCILYLEQDGEYLPQMFESHLQQILQTPYTKYIK
jgi:muramoyltetrapeptide carboxypeptidase LdcA involved in peptidoglycan recycling